MRSTLAATAFTRWWSCSSRGRRAPLSRARLRHTRSLGLQQCDDFSMLLRESYIWVYWLAKVFGLRLEIRLDDILYQKSFCGGYIIMYCLAVIEIRIGAFMGNVVSKVACEWSIYFWWVLWAFLRRYTWEHRWTLIDYDSDNCIIVQ